MNKTVLITLLLTFSYVGIAQIASYAYFEQSKKFQIEGTIKGYQPGNENGFITFRSYTIMGSDKDTAISINSNGSFSCELWQPFEGDIALMYNDEYIELYAKPSEKILIEIDEKKWKSEKNKVNAIAIQGGSASISNAMIDFEYERSIQQFKNNSDMGNKNQGDEGFARITVARMKEELDFFESYNLHKKKKDEKFIQWVRNKILYNAGRDIAFYCFAGKMNETITHSQLMALLSFIPINNLDALNNSIYYQFVHVLSGGFQIIVNINPAYKE